MQNAFSKNRGFSKRAYTPFDYFDSSLEISKLLNEIWGIQHFSAIYIYISTYSTENTIAETFLGVTTSAKFNQEKIKTQDFYSGASLYRCMNFISTQAIIIVAGESFLSSW